MKYTKNLNMKIPEGGDPINISDITGNFESLDDEMSKKANSTGGDISSTTIKTLDPVVEKFPVPVAGESAKVFLGKIKKFIEDFNAVRKVQEITLTAAGWTGSATPYTQTVTVTGATADMEAMVVSALADGATEAVQKAYSNAFGIVTSGTASLGNGSATFKVYKKPVTDIKIGLKGV